MVTYSQFVDELRTLVDQARTLRDAREMHENPAFRKWRHEVTDLILLMEDAGYSINCSIVSRDFDERGSYTYDPSSKERIAAFNRDLQDTVTELLTIISRFDKFGDPKSKVKTPQSLKPHEAVIKDDIKSMPSSGTLRDKFESHPVVWGLGLLAIGFGAGFTARAYFLSEAATKLTHAPITCLIEGVDRLEETHHLRVASLQQQLMKLEVSASDRMVIGSDQQKYKEAADRVRQDITSENSSYQATIQKLSKKCQ